MEAHPPFNVSNFYHGFRKHFICSLMICSFCFSTELVLGQIKDSDKKFIICHHLPDNPDKTITLEVGLDELQEHLDHGDTFGPCFDGDLSGDILPYFEPPVAKVEEEIGAALTSLVKQFEKLGSVPSDDIYIISGDRALIEIIAEDISSLSTIENYISTNYPDAVIYSDYGDANDDLIITVLFPINYLKDLNEDLYQENIVSFARPVYTPILKSGLVNSQGDITIQSDNARKAFESVDGSGVKVCVLSDSYNAKQKAKADIDNKDLPFDIDISEDFPSDYGAHFYVVDEGRAMMQIIHDVAPGASLGFRTGFKGVEHMADGIQILHTEHSCDVMVDDVTHLAEPFFVDGLISKAVDKVSNEGVTYISSAGNFANWGHADQFYPADGNETYHSFSRDGNIYQKVRFEKPGVYIIVLQWDDEYKSLGGLDNSGAQNDLDISLVDDSGNKLVSLNCKNTGGDPVEVMPIKVEKAGALANLVIQKAPGNANVNFKYIVFVGGQEFTVLSQPSGVSTIVGQANASKAYTVGAAFYDPPPALSVEPPTIELFSSHGGSLINGIDRYKPDFVGPDGVNTSVFSVGQDSEEDEDPFPNFLGTSAAAPHAAGIAALVLHAASEFDVPGIVSGETMKQTALDMYESGYDKLSGSGFLLADEAIMSFASPKPTITELIVPDNKTPGEKELTATIVGENLTVNSQVLLNGIPLNAKSVTFVDRSTIKAKIPAFTGDGLVQVYNPFITPSKLDGGYSNELSFFTIPQTKITVVADKKNKKFGEKNPAFTSSLFVNDIPLAESGLDPTEIARLSSIDFIYETASKEWDDTGGQYCSPTGIYYIHPIGIYPQYIANDPSILEDYDFDYVDDDKTGYIKIEKLPITIKPITKDSYAYGESFQDISFEYDLYSDGADNNENIDNLELLLEFIQEEHQLTFREEITNAIVDRARQLVNRGRQLVNESGWLISDATISNRARQLVNGDIAIDLDIDLITDYGINLNLDGTIPNRGRQLVNGEFFFNKESYIKDELGNRVRQLVNEGAIGVNESEGEDFANITLIVDTTDVTISNIYSINLISGFEVNPADGDPEYEGAPQYCVPGAFISPTADNFTIIYESADFDILPAALNVSIENKSIFMGDPMPEFTSTISGYQYGETERSVFSRINYTPTEYTSPGLYDIVPTFEWLVPVNYILAPDPIIPGEFIVSNLVNGRIALSSENESGEFDLTLINSDGTDPTPITSLLGEVHDPVFSPDSKEIVFTWKDNENLSDIWKINTDGTGLTRLSATGNSVQASYSMDGSQLIFIQDGDIAISNMSGVNAELIIETPEKEAWPFFSPDGKEIYFTRVMGGEVNEIFKTNIGPGSSDLISLWPGDGFDNDIISGYNGILLGGATFGPGKVNQAFQLDGIDDYVMVPHNSNLNFGKYDFTVSLWINFESTASEQILIEKWVQKLEGASTGWTLTKIEERDMRLALRDGIGPEEVLDVTLPSLDNNTWYHIAITREGDMFTMYWDGIAIGNLSCNYNLNSTSSLKMGHRGDPRDTPGSEDERGFYFKGYIDEVKIFDRALTPSEIPLMLLPAETQITYDGIFYRKPSFFRDGSKILTTRVDNSGLPSYEIMTMDPDGNNQTSIYTGPVRSASASPDGSKISFIADIEGTGGLYVMDANGSNVEELYTNGPLTVQEPDWGTYPDTYVTIPDPNFEQALIDLGIDSDGKLNQQLRTSDAKAVSFLDISDPENNGNLPNVDEKISDLTGIEAFENLEHLDCKFNLLTDLNLSDNLRLKHLSCEVNQLTNLDLSSNTLLEYLDCGVNQITNLDLTQNSALNVLICQTNQLTELDVSQNTELTHLTCWVNQLTSLNVSQCQALTELNCNDNQLTDLDISQNTMLIHLQCYSNQISSLNVSQNTLLEHLDCGANKLSNLDVSQNQSLIFLNCAHNQISNLDVSQNLLLTHLHCDSNQLTSLDVSQNNQLTEINCGLNQLSELDVTHNTTLVSLSCNWNQLTNLDVSKNNSLGFLDCGANKLTNLDISKNLQLGNLTCYENQLTSLDVSANTALTDLSCDVNQITSLDVSNNLALTYLYCATNQLASLDVRNGNNANFITFVADNNNLTCISVDDETADHSDWIVDLGVSFSNDCSIPVPVAIPNGNFEQALIDLSIDSDGMVNQQISRYDVLVITELDVSDPINNPNLPNVETKISDLTGIEAFANLTRLFCQENELSSIDLSQNSALIELQCGSNKLTSIDVSQNKALEVLNCQVNQLTSLDVSQNTSLNSLDIQVNQITTIDISSLTLLWQFNCEANQITSLNLTQNPLLRDFGCGGNPLLNLDISQNTALESLRCYANGLTSLDVTPHTALTELLCGSNQLTELNLSNNTNLIILDCGHNQLGNIDLSNNTSLANIHCGANQLNELDLYLNIALTDLTCYENQLTSLDVSQNTALVALSCDFNQITSLDVSNNPALTYLFCATNQLTTLDVRNGNNANFTTFVADINNLTCINVDDETADHSSWIVDTGVSFSNDCGIPVNVSIPDSNFEQALIDLGIDSDGIINQQISKYDALVVTELDISDPLNNENLPNVITKISDLTGIEEFTNLARLYCQFNQLTNLDLSQNTALTQIWCFNNQITALDFSQNPVLNDLLCYENELSSLDVSQNSALMHLNCYGNQLTSLDVSQNTALTGLSCYDNQLTGLNISQNTALTGLDCAGNQLTSLDVSANTDLTYLSCPFNQITSLDVAVNTKLVHLLVAGNQFESLDISTNTAITNLYCEGNQLTSIDLTQNPSLEYLRCFDNLLTSLDLTSNPALTQLECWSNQLTSIDVRNGNNAIFTTFVANNNNLTCISVDDETVDHSSWIVDPGVMFSNSCDEFVIIPDANFEQVLIDQGIDTDQTLNKQISREDAEAETSLYVYSKNIGDLTGIEGFINLTNLDCSDNQLTALDLSNNTKLTSLVCHSNNIEVLNLTNLTDLIQIYCYYNNMYTLDVSQMPNLQRLWCYSNNLGEENEDIPNTPQLLDVSNNPELQELMCHNNKLWSLDVSKNTKLTRLECFANNLEVLDVTNNPDIHWIRCGVNPLTELDLSNQTTLTRVECDLTDLVHIDMRNGNNHNIILFNATNNGELTCISVDDENSDHSTWSVDQDVIFSNDCSTEFVYIPDANFEQALIDESIDTDGIINQMILREDAEAITGTLYLASRNITDLTGIEAFVNITQLECQENQLTEIDISQNSALLYLFCYENSISSLDVSYNTDLITLSCGSNELNSLDVSNNLQLELLNTRNNNLTSLDLTSNTALKRLFCETNQIQSLDLSNNTLLEVIFCLQNNLTSLDLSDNLLLTELVIGGNLLTELDVSNNTLLQGLYCWHNQINSVDLTSNLALERISIFNNQLTSLDVSNNTNLEMLLCGTNQLNFLDVSNNTLLNDLSVSNNFLTYLDLSNNSALSEIQCNDNDLTSLDMRNMNNLNVTDFHAENNNLTCIDVDDETADHSLWIVDAGVTFSNDCALEALIADAIGDGSIIVDGNVTLYPNPVIDWLTIEFTDESVVLGEVDITIYNDQPSIETLSIIESPSVYGFEVDFNSIISGTYYLRLFDGYGTRVFRLIKE